MLPSRTIDLGKVLPPLLSLQSKSEKALESLAAGTWQHTRLASEIEAIKLALYLMQPPSGDDPAPDLSKRKTAQMTLSALISRVEGVRAKFVEGSAQHTLQDNRLFALRVAEAVVGAGGDANHGAGLI